MQRLKEWFFHKLQDESRQYTTEEQCETVKRNASKCESLGGYTPEYPTPNDTEDDGHSDEKCTSVQHPSEEVSDGQASGSCNILSRQSKAWRSSPSAESRMAGYASEDDGSAYSHVSSDRQNCGSSTSEGSSLWHTQKRSESLKEELHNIKQTRQFLEIIDSAILTFNMFGPLPAFLLLKQNSILDIRNPLEIAAYLFFTPGLEKKNVGKFLVIPDELNVQALNYFLHFFNFANMDLVSALRLLFCKLQPPGESQQLFRIVNAFSTAYVNDNVETQVLPDDIAYVTYAILMLHTDKHNAKVRRKMTKDAFLKLLLKFQVKSTSGPDDPATSNFLFDKKYLESVYEDVVSSEFQILHSDSSLVYSRLSNKEFQEVFHQDGPLVVSTGIFSQHEESLLQRMKNGTTFIKYCRNGNPKLRLVKLSQDETRLMWMPVGSYGVELLHMKGKKQPRYIYLEHIIDISIQLYVGFKKTRPPLRTNNLCCVIHSYSRILELCVPTEVNIPVEAWAAIILFKSQMIRLCNFGSYYLHTRGGESRKTLSNKRESFTLERGARCLCTASPIENVHHNVSKRHSLHTAGNLVHFNRERGTSWYRKYRRRGYSFPDGYAFISSTTSDDKGPFIKELSNGTTSESSTQRSLSDTVLEHYITTNGRILLSLTERRNWGTASTDTTAIYNKDIWSKNKFWNKYLDDDSSVSSVPILRSFPQEYRDTPSDKPDHILAPKTNEEDELAVWRDDILANWDYHWHGLKFSYGLLPPVSRSFNNREAGSSENDYSSLIAVLNLSQAEAESSGYTDQYGSSSNDPLVIKSLPSNISGTTSTKRISSFLDHDILQTRRNSFLESSIATKTEPKRLNPRPWDDLALHFTSHLNSLSKIAMLNIHGFRWLMSGVNRVTCLEADCNPSSFNEHVYICTVLKKCVPSLYASGRIQRSLSYWETPSLQPANVTTGKRLANFMKSSLGKVNASPGDFDTKNVSTCLPLSHIPHYGNHVSRISSTLLTLWWTGVPKPLRPPLWMLALTNRASVTGCSFIKKIRMSFPVRKEEQQLFNAIYNVTHYEVISAYKERHAEPMCPCYLESGWLNVHQTSVTSATTSKRKRTCRLSCTFHLIGKENGCSPGSTSNAAKQVALHREQWTTNEGVRKQNTRRWTSSCSQTRYSSAHTGLPNRVLSCTALNNHSLKLKKDALVNNGRCTSGSRTEDIDSYSTDDPLKRSSENRKMFQCSSSHQLWHCAIAQLCLKLFKLFPELSKKSKAVIHISAVITSITSSPQMAFSLLQSIIFSSQLPIYDLLMLDESPTSQRNFARLQLFQILLCERLPVLFKHFKTLQISPELYVSSWFEQLFSGFIPSYSLPRLWDRILLGGETIMFQVALGVLYYHQVYLLNLGFTGCLQLLLLDDMKMRDELPLVAGCATVTWNKTLLFDDVRFWRCIDHCTVDPQLVRLWIYTTYSRQVSTDLQRLLSENT